MNVMDVQSSSQKKIVRIRTFQNDVAVARMAQGITAPTTPSATASSVALPTKKAYVPSTVLTQEKLIEQPHVKTPPLQNSPIVSTPLPKVSVKPVARVVPVTPIGVVPTVVPPTPKVSQYGSIADEIAGVAKSHAPSILSDSTDSYDGEALGSGTIIRDTKRKRFKLFPAMLSAITSWTSDTKEAYVASQIPLHTVAKAEKRIDTIVKAATQSEQAPKEDFKKVAEHLKTLERKPIHSTLLFKDKESVPAPTWASANEEATTPASIEAAPEPTPQPVQIQTIPEPVVEEQVQAPISEAPAVAEVAYVESPRVQVRPEPTYSEEQEIPTEAPIAQRQRETPQPRYAPPRQTSSSFPFYALISVILIASLAGITFSYYLFAEKSGTVSRVDTPIYEVPKLIRAQDNTSFVLPENRNELLQTLLSKLDTSNTVTQMYPTVSEGENAQKPAPAEAIVAVFAPRAPGSFTRSIKEITFGSSQNAEPFIIMKATSFDVAFAGMLTWEIMMSADLAPLFGPTVLETFDPQARTASGARDAFFKDVIASNKSARVLLDENGDDRIVYTFTDQNTILITTNRETLAELIGLVN
jgi:hypothetical protein